MNERDLEDYGRYAYQAFVGSRWPDQIWAAIWDEVPTNVQRAWIAAAAAVLDTARSVSDL